MNTIADKNTSESFSSEFVACYKSTTGSLIPLWIRARTMAGFSTGFNFFVVVSKSEDAAMSLLGDLQAELAHNEAYSQDFGVKTDKGREWQSGRFSISDGTTFVALGRGQSLRDLKKRGRRRFFLSSGSRYRKLESLLSDLYQSPLCACPEHLAHDNDPSNPFTEKDIKAAFNVVHSALKMTPELLSERPIQRVIRKTADYFSGVISEKMPPKMADALRNDLYIFSGFKTYHELKEASERLLRQDGSLKPFKEFYQDTRKVRDRYNKAWLKAEYNYAVRTADAAARWAEIEKDKEHIDLLYETVGDGRVRPDHAALEGVCLPVDDPFWALAYPPNGWNCRCRVLRVAKGSHPYSNSSEATDAYLEATAGKNELFRYNPGKEQRIFADKHPYYGKRGIMHCSVKVDKLAANLDNNEKCEVLRRLQSPGLSLDKEIREIIEKEGKSERAATRKAYKNTLKKDFYPEVIRKELQLPNGKKKMIPITFRGYGIEHMIDDLMGNRCRGVSLDELLYLEDHIQNATQINRNGNIYKNRRDNIDYFYYLETNINGVDVEIHLARQRKRNDFFVYPYCIKKR